MHLTDYRIAREMLATRYEETRRIRLLRLLRDANDAPERVRPRRARARLARARPTVPARGRA